MSDHKTSVTENNQMLPKEPVVNADGIKIYPTSFLPAKSLMEPSRIPTAKMTGFQIEVLHVVIFFALTYMLFVGMWKRPNKR